MKDLIIERQKKDFYTFPEVNFDAETGKCTLEGESFMENAREFYDPIHAWLDEYHKTNRMSDLEMNIKLSYYNTSSSKSLHRMITQLKGFTENGQTISINWHYSSGDREMEDDIMDLQIETGMTINMVSK
jgi:hypothetical protein